jgi:hypothetical protein
MTHIPGGRPFFDFHFDEVRRWKEEPLPEPVVSPVATQWFLRSILLGSRTPLLHLCQKELQIGYCK